MRIRFDRITVSVDRDRRLLDTVSGEIAAGAVTAVVGPSGAGKSTLLGVLSGLRRPTSGQIWLGEVDVTPRPPEARGLGVVFQDLRLFPFLSARDNVAFGPKVARLARREVDARVDEALTLVRARHLAEAPVQRLSGGERQRIAIARALAIHPAGLLLDEPFGALDAELKRELRDELYDLSRRLRLTVVIVTHDRDDAFALASRLIVLNEGRVEQAGELAECYEAPTSAFVARLLGEAALLPIGARAEERAEVAGRWLRVRGAGTRVVVRPEALALADGGKVAFQGTLSDVRFEGGSWRIRVELEGGAGALVARVARAPTSSEVSLSVAEPLPTV